MEEPKKSYADVLMDGQKRLLENAPAAADKDSTGSLRMHAIIHMAAWGMKPKDIAIQMKVSATRIYHILASQSAKKEIARIQQDLYVNNPTEMFRKMLPSAAKTVRKIMMDKEEKGSNRLNAAGMVLDRALGKAVQPIEHQGSAIKELLMALDKSKAEPQAKSSNGEIIEADFKEVTPEKPKDDLDSWLDDNF